ncbi:MAG: tetratricopeptide repeat protein [Ignavibacterium sp.]
MNDFEKIIELLDKENISEDEKHLLDEIFTNNPEAKKLGEFYLNLKTSLKRDEHIDEELLADYVMYKNNLSPERLVVLLANKIEDHLRNCVQCKKLFTELNTEYCDVDTFVRQSLVEQVNKTKPTKSAGFFSLNKFNAAKYALASLTAIVALYFGLFAVSEFITPDYKKSFLDGEDFYTTRGRTTELFQRALDAIDRKDYDSAVEYLNEDIITNNSDGSIFYAHFILGITYVSKAESDFLGLFKSYNTEDVKKGIQHFEKSIELNNSGRFDNLKLDAHYFIGKSYLMIDDKTSAREHLKLVVDGKGSYYKKAEEILKEL